MEEVGRGTTQNVFVSNLNDPLAKVTDAYKKVIYR